jgi:hypothetical protein
MKLLAESSIFNFVVRCNPRGKAGPGLIAQHLPGWKRASCRVFAKFFIKKCVVKSSARRIGRRRAVINSVESCPVGSRETHRARLATGVEIAARKRERSQRFASRSNRVDLAVSSGIVRRGYSIHAFSNDATSVHNHCGKRSAPAGFDVLNGQFNGAAKKLRVRFANCQLAHNLLQRRK